MRILLPQLLALALSHTALAAESSWFERRSTFLEAPPRQNRLASTPQATSAGNIRASSMPRGTEALTPAQAGEASTQVARDDPAAITPGSTPAVLNEVAQSPETTVDAANIESTLPVNQDEEKDDLSCSICLEKLEDEGVAPFACFDEDIPHAFHRACAEEWMREEGGPWLASCPMVGLAGVQRQRSEGPGKRCHP